MRAGRRRLAHTLIELVVSMALFVYLMIMVGWALVYCNQYLRNAETRAEAQTQALAACIWLSRSLSESNATLMTTTSAAGIYGVAFPSPRDPSSGDVAWSTGSGAILWRQMMYAYLVPSSDGESNLVMRAFPLSETGGGVSSMVTTGYPPFPAGAPDLPASVPDLAFAMAHTTVLNRTVAHNIRQLTVDLYLPTGSDASLGNTANITLESYAPFYGLNYGVTVESNVRIQN